MIKTVVYDLYGTLVDIDSVRENVKSYSREMEIGLLKHGDIN